MYIFQGAAESNLSSFLFIFSVYYSSPHKSYISWLLSRLTKCDIRLMSPFVQSFVDMPSAFVEESESESESVVE